MLLFCERTIRVPKPKPYPKQLNTLGDRLLAYRLDHTLTKARVAKLIGVTPHTVRNWELNRTNVEVRYYPKILSLIGAALHEATHTLGARYRAERRKRGLSAKRLAVLVGVDEATVRRLEADTPGMARRAIVKIITHLDVPR